MQAVTIKTANSCDEPNAIATIVMAFSSDPAARWVYPDPLQYLAHFPCFVRAFGGKAFGNGTAHVAEEYAGAALWLPPEVQPDEEELAGVLDRTVASAIRSDVFAVFDQMGRCHPREPHWYLPLIGVENRFQGRGYGSALLSRALAECDRDRLPAYLESSNPRNIPLYERHGFQVVGTIQAGSSPALYPMLRKPRPAGPVPAVS
ncbi:MAG: GNAT family N-acetyltransferase [Bryobacterales bacterium]|nr:GNAT family N-acetyltransferase [Bryobacterales bacterium]